MWKSSFTPETAEVVAGNIHHGSVNESTPSSRNHHDPTTYPHHWAPELALRSTRWVPKMVGEMPPVWTRHLGPCRPDHLGLRWTQENFERMGSSRVGSWVGVGVGLHMWACCSKAVFQRSFEVPAVHLLFAEKRTLYSQEPWFRNTHHVQLWKVFFFQRCCVSVLHSVVKQDLPASREGPGIEVWTPWCVMCSWCLCFPEGAGCLSNMEASETNLSERPRWVGDQGCSHLDTATLQKTPTLSSKLVISKVLRELLLGSPPSLLSGPLNICYKMLLTWEPMGMFEEALRVFYIPPRLLGSLSPSHMGQATFLVTFCWITLCSLIQGQLRHLGG